MKAPISRNTAPHYLWGGVCDGWRLVDQAGMRVVEERVPPGGAESRHYHRVARQFFYVLEGEATLEIEGIEHRLVRGAGLEVAPGQRHRFSNRAVTDVRFLVISAPTTAGDRFEAEAAPSE